MRKTRSNYRTQTAMALALSVTFMGAMATAQSVSEPVFHGMTTGGGVGGDNLGDHTATMHLELSGFRLTNVGAPNAITDGVNVAYLNARLATHGDDLGNHVATTHLNMDGNEVINVGDPSTQTSAVNLRTVQNMISSGGDNLGNHTATAELDMNLQGIRNLADPWRPRDAVNMRTMENAINAIPGDNLGDHLARQDIDLQNFRIVGLADPVEPEDGVNLRTVEALIAGLDVDPGPGSGGGGEGYVAGSGISISGDVIAVNSAVVRTTGNQSIAGNKSFTGVTSFGGQRVTNVADPTNSMDAANRRWVLNQIDAVPTAPAYTGGTGIAVTGSTIAFDTAWGDGRYALRSRTITAGTGLTGGGNLQSNRTLNFNTNWGDNRYAQHVTAGFSTSVTYDSMFGTTGDGAFTFAHSTGAAPADAPLASQSSAIHIGNTWGRAQMVFPNSESRMFFRSGTRTNWQEIWHSGNFNPGSYVQTSRTITAGDGLTGGGNLSSNRTIAVDGTVVRTSGSQVIQGQKTFRHGSAGTRFQRANGKDMIRILPADVGSNNRMITIATPTTALQASYTLRLAAGNTTLVPGTMVATTRQILAGTGLSGGGTLGGDRTLSLQANQIRRAASASAQGVVAYNGHTHAQGQFYGGTTNPSHTQRLNYSGNLWARNFYSQAYFHYSDASLKENVESLETTDLVDRLRELRPVSYNWIESGEQAMGLIAQEVQEVFPFMVSGGGDEILTVDYSQLISPMLASIQRLDRDLEAERAKNAELMAILGSMEERLRALENLTP